MEEKNHSQDSDGESEEERFDLLRQIEALKSKIRQELTLILEHPRTPKEFREHAAVKDAVE